MPRERKPLIEPNILPAAAREENGDVLSRILASDRARRQPVAEEPLEGEAPESEGPAATPGTETPDRDARFRQAMALVDAPEEFVVATFRMPAKLNDYLDRYVARMNEVASKSRPKRRYRKIDAVTEAFAAFYADHPLPPAAPDEI